MARNTYAHPVYSFRPEYMDLAKIELSDEQKYVQNFLVDELSAVGLEQLADSAKKRVFYETIPEGD